MALTFPLDDTIDQWFHPFQKQFIEPVILDEETIHSIDEKNPDLHFQPPYEDISNAFNLLELASPEINTDTQETDFLCDRYLHELILHGMLSHIASLQASGIEFHYHSLGSMKCNLNEVDDVQNNVRGAIILWKAALKSTIMEWEQKPRTKRKRVLRCVLSLCCETMRIKNPELDLRMMRPFESNLILCIEMRTVSSTLWPVRNLFMFDCLNQKEYALNSLNSRESQDYVPHLFFTAMKEIFFKNDDGWVEMAGGEKVKETQDIDSGKEHIWRMMFSSSSDEEEEGDADKKNRAQQGGAYVKGREEVINYCPSSSSSSPSVFYSNFETLLLVSLFEIRSTGPNHEINLSHLEYVFQCFAQLARNAFLTNRKLLEGTHAVFPRPEALYNLSDENDSNIPLCYEVFPGPHYVSIVPSEASGEKEVENYVFSCSGESGWEPITLTRK